jgi:predicted AlkP superfamily phosphohydrolase/phosphomutase
MQTLILGFDAFDPRRFERLAERGKLPNLMRYVEASGYARFRVSNPAQTEVSWTSMATGLNPGGHGIFDFVHRNPKSYAPYVSLLPTEGGVLGTRFVAPYQARTIFEEAADQGFPATAFWWPATFPARPALPVHTFPGLGTPDILGRLGVGTLFATDSELASEKRKTVVAGLEARGGDLYTARLEGPTREGPLGSKESALQLDLLLTGEETARLRIGERTVELMKGSWSPILKLSFKMGLLVQMQALTRVILTQVQPNPRLYILPLQLHPLGSPWRYATPPGFVRHVWKAHGPFLTLGWPQDTTGLEEDCITDEQFLDLCGSIHEAREHILMAELARFDEGLLATVFDSLDRVQHMFWRERPDIVDDWYIRLDGLVGRVEQRLAGAGQENTKILVVSDHGFADFDQKVHLNRWLLERGYLATKGENGTGELRDVDWSDSQAYAVGLNSIYVNLQAREGEGSVPPEQVEPLVNRLRGDLLSWRGPDGGPVVQRAWRRDEAFVGPLAERGPDLVVGYTPGYRASAETGMGEWTNVTIEPNQDHWGADHCVDPEAVPGVVFANRGLDDFPQPSYLDFPALAIGMTPDSNMEAPPPSFSDEDQEVVEDRLRSLGYL